MSAYLQIEGDPTKWWPTGPIQASQLSFVVLVTPIVPGIGGPMAHD